MFCLMVCGFVEKHASMLKYLYVNSFYGGSFHWRLLLPPAKCFSLVFVLGPPCWGLIFEPFGEEILEGVPSQ
jgi:hypothetical protein